MAQNQLKDDLAYMVTDHTWRKVLEALCELALEAQLKPLHVCLVIAKVEAP